MQNLNKANYYHQRAMKGILEKDDSWHRLMASDQKNSVERLQSLEKGKDNLKMYYMMINDPENMKIAQYRNILISTLFRISNNNGVSGYEYFVSETIEDMTKYTSLPSPSSIFCNKFQEIMKLTKQYLLIKLLKERKEINRW